jgi:rhodanese-related sulfurtransferase
MNHLISRNILIVLCVLNAFISSAQSEEYKAMLEQYYDGFPTISAAETRKLIGVKNVYILDARSKAEYQISHINNAKRVGYENFRLNSVENIPKEAKIIVYCSVGARSQTIGRKLNKGGYSNVKNLYGGLFLWNNKKYPIVDPSGHTTNKIHGYSKEWGKWITHGTVVY